MLFSICKSMQFISERERYVLYRSCTYMNAHWRNKWLVIIISHVGKFLHRRRHGAVAQLVECSLSMREVPGSKPGSSISILHLSSISNFSFATLARKAYGSVRAQSRHILDATGNCYSSPPSLRNRTAVSFRAC